MTETARSSRRGAARADVSPDFYRLAMRRGRLAITMIAARHGEVRNGLTATAVCSASADPPILVVCVNRTASAHDLIVESGAFVNFLDPHDQAAIARLFSTAKLTPEARFAEGAWKEAATGSPMLEGALSAFDCQTVQTQSFDSHTVFFGRVCAAETLGGDALLYRDGYFRRLEPKLRRLFHIHETRARALFPIACFDAVRLASSNQQP